MLSLLRLLPGVSRGLTATLALTTLVGAVLPTVFVLVTGRLVGTLPEAVAEGWDGPAGGRLVMLLLVAAAVLAVAAVVNEVQAVAGRMLGHRVQGDLRRRVMEAALAPAGIEHLEHPDFARRFGLARNLMPAGFEPFAAVWALWPVLAGFLTPLVSLVLVATYSLPVAAVVLTTWAAAQWLALRMFFDMTAAFTEPGVDLRRAEYFRNLGVGPDIAKETRVFGLVRWLERSFAGAWEAGMRVVRARRRGHGRALLAWGALEAIGLGAGLAFAVTAGVRGSLDLGDVTVMAGAVFSAMSLRVSDQHLALAYGAAAVPAMLEVEPLARGPRFAVGGRRPAAGMPARDIRFEAVSFSYPGADRLVLRDLDLEIPSGQRLAVVGLNGAGKTTLVKLLCGFYPPTAGRILIDGADLEEIDPRAWQRRLSVLFQDFVRYQLTAAENVAVGAGRLEAQQAEVVGAARRAGAEAFVETLPHGWETTLAAAYDGGVDLSGGQWQRIALARALLAAERGARVLVLDEPAANLDVRGEAELYERFLELTAPGRADSGPLTTILISHRFSTVRQADRIVVLDEGRVVEDGSHDELLDLGGRYAAMFRAQATRFDPSTEQGEPVDA